MAASSTFTSFTDLPIELRLHIWKLACFQQRNIDVSFRARGIVADVGRSESLTAYTGGSLVTCTKPPPILHVNRQSRVEALKYYSHVDFSCPVFSGALKGSQFYINWEIDRLCFSSMIDLMDRERGWYSPGISLTAIKVRKICLKNGLRYLGWNIADIESLGTVENYILRAHQSTEVVRTLPWSHQIDDFVIFYNKGTENSNSRGEIVEFGSTPLILRGKKTWLHGIHFNTAGSNFQTGNVTQGAGPLFIYHLDDLDWRWWFDHKFLGQETTIHAFEQGREARKAVHRVRLVYNVERVGPATILSRRLLSKCLDCLPNAVRVPILILLARIYFLWKCLVIYIGFLKHSFTIALMIPMALYKATLLAYGCYVYLKRMIKGM